MAINKRLLVKPPSTGITPSEHFGVVLYEGDGSSSHSINGGKFGAGAYFKGGTSNNIDLDINLTTKKTISMWVKNNSFPAYNVHLIRPSTDNLNFGFLQSTRTVFLWDGNSTQNWGYAIPNDTNFHHLVLAIDGTNAKLYVDNDDKGSITIVANSQTQLRLGRNSGTSGLDGVMDQVRIFQKQLSSSEVSTLYAETVSTVESLDPLSEDTTDTLQVLGDSSCIATYRFENDETDLSGNYDGTGTEIQYAAGRYGQAASFNGSSSYITSTLSGFTGNPTFSISFWVNPTSIGTPIMLGNASNGAAFVTFINSSNKLNFGRYGDSLGDSTASVPNNTWTHIAISNNAGSVQLYINGTADLSFSTTYNIGSNNLYLFTAVTGQVLQGKLDQVRIFNKAISASEVTTLYQENSLVASYRFEGNANDDMRTYDGTATNVTYEYGLGFTPDFVWIKQRDAVRGQNWFDSSRGVYNLLQSNNTNANTVDSTQLTSFDSGGFAVGSGVGVNASGGDYVAWCFKANGGTTSSNTDGTVTSTVQANTDSGFSIVTATAPSSGVFTVGHGLNAEIDLYIIKNTSSTGGWVTYVRDLGADKYLELQSLNAAGTSVNFWDNTNPTSSVFTMKAGYVITGSSNFVAYCFKSIDSFSKFGSYVGDLTSQTNIETGFEPAFVIIKCSSGFNSGDWILYDNKRNPTNPKINPLLIRPYAEQNALLFGINFNSNGFSIPTTCTTNSVNQTGYTYIYMAFAADPDTEAPTVAKSFSTVTYDGTGSAQTIEGLGFSPSLVWIKNRAAANSHNIYDTIRGATKLIESDTTDAEVTSSTGLTEFTNDGFSVSTGSGVNNATGNYVAWAWKADDNEPTIFGGPAIAVYKFEDNANDVTGNYNGTASSSSYSSGKFGKAFNCANTRYINVSNLPELSTERSVSLWVNASTIDNTDRLFGFVEGGKYFNISFGANNNISAYTGGVSLISSNNSISANTWHHIVLVVKGTIGKVYIDGVEAVSQSITSYTINPTSAYIGTNEGAVGVQTLNGLIDQVRIYNGALAQEQVTELYNETSSDNDDLTLGAPAETIISANANAGFSIVKYEGNGVAGQKVPHGLSAAPEMIIIKNLDDTDKWAVYNSSIGATKFLVLNETAAAVTSSAYWNDTAPTSTVFTLGATSPVNSPNNENYIAYCFHSVSGYSKFGSYTGNGGSTSVSLGFQPDWVMWKATNNAENWYIMDSVRGVNNVLYADGSFAEGTSSGVSFTSTGFTVTSSFNQSGRTFVYMAIKIN